MLDFLFNTSHTMDVKTGVMIGLLCVGMIFFQSYYQATHPMDGKSQSKQNGSKNSQKSQPAGKRTKKK